MKECQECTKTASIKCGFFGIPHKVKTTQFGNVKQMEQTIIVAISYFILKFKVTWEVGEVCNYILGSKTGIVSCFVQMLTSAWGQMCAGKVTASTPLGPSSASIATVGTAWPRADIARVSAQRGWRDCAHFWVLSGHDCDMQGWVEQLPLMGPQPGASRPPTNLRVRATHSGSFHPQIHSLFTLQGLCVEDCPVFALLFTSVSARPSTSGEITLEQSQHSKRTQT